MATTKLAVTMDSGLLKRLDRSVRGKRFKNRSQAIQAAVREKLERMDRTRLARECSKLEPKMEQAMADEGLAKDLAEWPEY